MGFFGAEILFTPGGRKNRKDGSQDSYILVIQSNTNLRSARKGFSDVIKP